MKKYLIVPAIAAMMISPAFAQSATNAPTQSDVNNTQATTKGEDAATPGTAGANNPAASSGIQQSSEPPAAGSTGGMSAPGAMSGSGNAETPASTTKGSEVK